MLQTIRDISEVARKAKSMTVKLEGGEVIEFVGGRLSMRASALVTIVDEEVKDQFGYIAFEHIMWKRGIGEVCEVDLEKHGFRVRLDNFTIAVHSRVCVEFTHEKYIDEFMEKYFPLMDVPSGGITDWSTLNLNPKRVLEIMRKMNVKMDVSKFIDKPGTLGLGSDYKFKLVNKDFTYTIRKRVVEIESEFVNTTIEFHL